MNKRAYNIAYVNAELRAKLAIGKFEKEFRNNGNQNQSRNVPQVRQDNNATRVVPQQPVYGS